MKIQTRAHWPPQAHRAPRVDAARVAVATSYDQTESRVIQQARFGFA